jgi:hypothetical protein
LHRSNFEEFGLRLAVIAALGIPPTGAIAINDMPTCAGNGLTFASEADQWTFPLLVAESGFAAEDEL